MNTVKSLLRLVGYLVAFVAITVVLMALTKQFLGDWEAAGVHLELLGDGLLTALGIALTNLVIFGLSRSREVFRGWPGLRTGTRWFVGGALAGIAMAGTMLLLTVGVGGARVVLEDVALRPYLLYVVPLGGCLLVSALGEEWLFRGYPLTNLASFLGRGWANVVMGVLFAAAHLGSTGTTSLVQVNIVLGSLVLGALRFGPGGIPAAWGFHFAWNFTQVLGGATLSLENLHVPGVAFAARGSTLLSGGEFGPEGGLGATVATVLVLALLVVRFRRRGVRDLPIPLGRFRKPAPPSDREPPRAGPTPGTNY